MAKYNREAKNLEKSVFQEQPSERKSFKRKIVGKLFSTIANSRRDGLSNNSEYPRAMNKRLKFLTKSFLVITCFLYFSKYPHNAILLPYKAYKISRNLFDIGESNFKELIEREDVQNFIEDVKDQTNAYFNNSNSSDIKKEYLKYISSILVVFFSAVSIYGHFKGDPKDAGIPNLAKGVQEIIPDEY